MQIKTFTAEDMPAALQKVKQALGPDALILSTRTLRKKGLGLLGKALIEVQAAIESPAKSAPRVAQTTGRIKPLAAAKTATAAYGAHESGPASSKPRNSQPVISPLEAEVSQLRETLAAQNVGQLQQEMSELKQMVQQLASVQQSAPPVAEESKAQPLAAPRIVQAVSATVYDALSSRGIDNEAAETIGRFADSRMSAEQRQDPRLQHQFLRDTIADLVQVNEPIWGPEVQGQKRVALVGPTGVGKTTTIAKLAASAVAAGARVALVTIDTFRIAAVEQLKVYGEIMNLPVEVIFQPEQLAGVLQQHRDKDLILIDTAGRSPRDSQRIDELASLLNSDLGIESWLVLSAHSREQQLQQVVAKFSPVSIKSLVLTKLDECESWGTLINLPIRTALSLACLTNGQQVPEDLLMAEPQLVANWVMGGEPQAQKDVV